MLPGDQVNHMVRTENDFAARHGLDFAFDVYSR